MLELVRVVSRSHAGKPIDAVIVAKRLREGFLMQMSQRDAYQVIAKVMHAAESMQLIERVDEYRIRCVLPVQSSSASRIILNSAKTSTANTQIAPERLSTPEPLSRKDRASQSAIIQQLTTKANHTSWEDLQSSFRRGGMSLDAKWQALLDVIDSNEATSGEGP